MSRRFPAALAVLSPLSLAVTVGCTSPCTGARIAVVTDIDETLTTANSEWVDQLLDPTADPAMRPSADEVMQTYDSLGYTMVYITARGENLTVADGRDARTATVDWLAAHGFPYTDDHVFLASGIGASGASAVAYKSGVIEDMQAQGWSFAAAYGNADTDIDAFQTAGIADDKIWFVGRLSATRAGVNPLPDEEAFESHLVNHVSGVVSACDL